MQAPFSRIAVVGSGALGIYYGARLAAGGAEVRFLMRGDLAAVRVRGTVIARVGAEVIEARPAGFFGASAEMGPADLVLVTLKATANAALGELLAPLLGKDTAVLTLQNGLGPDEALAELVGPERVLGGLAFIAVNRIAPGEVFCHHPGYVTLGEFAGPATERTRAVAARFEASGMRIRLTDCLLDARWHKLVWNIPFNGLAIAAGGLTTDRLCADPILRANVMELMREVQQGAAAFGVTITDDFLQQQYDVTPPMGAYAPSSLVDFRAGREVEVEMIWGEPLRRARAAGVATPRLAELYEALKKATVPASSSG